MRSVFGKLWTGVVAACSVALTVATLSSCSFLADDNVVLVARKRYVPSRWDDAKYAPKKDIAFKIPEKAEVLKGNSGNHWVTLSWVEPKGQKGECRYKGGSDQANPKDKKQLEKGKYYHLKTCTGNKEDGDVVTARLVKFHVDNGGNGSKHEETVVAIALALTSQPSPTPSPSPQPTEPPAPTPTPSAVPTSSPTPVWQAQGWQSAPPSTLPGASNVSQTTSTHVGQSVRFLYEGTNPLQKGVAPGAIDVLRSAVIRGRVLDKANAPLAGVKVSVIDNPHYGTTESRANGEFDLVVNAGEAFGIAYEKPGFLVSHRVISVPQANDARVLEDVVLVGLDAKVTVITAGRPELQVAQSSVVSDESGARQVTVLFPGSTTAVARKSDGSTVPLSTLSLRVTEYTQGVNGENAMPAPLPPNAGYTYAAEFSVDEAIAAGAHTVEFSQPVTVHLDNFLNFPVGARVPSGFYDRQRATWVPTPDGRVIQILGADAQGKARVSFDADGTEATPERLAFFGFTQDELVTLGRLYTPGKTLWRVQHDHFSPYDYNFPQAWRFPDDVFPPDQPPGECQGVGPGASCTPSRKPEPDSCTVTGSIIECENQVLRQQVGLQGSPHALAYASRLQPAAHTDTMTLRIPITGPDGLPAKATGYAFGPVP